MKKALIKSSAIFLSAVGTLSTPLLAHSGSHLHPHGAESAFLPLALAGFVALGLGVLVFRKLSR